MATNKPAREATDEPQGSVEPSQIDAMEAQMARFMARFSDQMEKTASALTERVEERLAAVERRVDERLTGINPGPGIQAQMQAAGLLAPPPAGTAVVQLPPPVPEQTMAEIQASQRKVAFIPKDDPLNPRAQHFECWLNGTYIKIKRGDVGMLPIGFALDLARSGHGHVIDMAAWQQIPVQTVPDLSINPNDDRLPRMTSEDSGVRPSIPPSWLTTAV